MNERSIIRASHDGRLNYTDDLKQGDAVQQQQKLGFIFTEDNQVNTKYIEVFISEMDCNKVQLGNEVKVYLNGINEAKFKFIRGKIETISNSLKKDERTGNYFYSLRISINQDYLQSTQEAIQLNQSMPTISYIFYEKESLLDWFLKQLNFRKS